MNSGEFAPLKFLIRGFRVRAPGALLFLLTSGFIASERSRASET
jgi:hypothetical protein